jgi:hypothetical protein
MATFREINDSNISNAQNTLHGTRLFNRQLNLVIGVPNSSDLVASVAFNEKNANGRDISGLDVEFMIEKSTKSDEPNTCSLKIHNLAEDTRRAMSGVHPLTVRLEAGYVGAVSQLYFSEIHSAWTVRDGPEFITHLESRDTIARPTGSRRTKKLLPGAINGNIYVTKGARISLDDAFTAIHTALGVGEGNLRQALKALHNPRVNSVNGHSVLGNGAQRMTDLCRSAGLEWSIQDGQLQLINIAESLGGGTNAIEVSANTGMWDDSPIVDTQGAVTVTTALIPGLAPGVLVNIDSLFVNGGYRIEKIRYRGNTRGQEWTAHFDACKY